MSMRTILISLAAMLTWFCTVSVADVRDNARMFSPQAVQQANQTIEQIRQKDRKDIVIETFPSIPEDAQSRFGYSPDQKGRFFSAWATDRARTQRVNGIYVLVTRNPAYVEVGVGSQTQAQAFNRDNRRQFQSILIDNFRQQRFDEGLVGAVKYAQQAMQANLGRGGSGQPQYLYQAPSERSSRGTGMSWIWILLIGGLVVWLLMRFLRRRNTPAMGASGPMYRGGMGGPGGPVGGYGPGGGYGQQGGYGQGGFGQGGFGQGGMGGGGGMGRGLLGGLLGGAAGGWLYDKFARGGSSSQAQTPPGSQPPAEAPPPDQGQYDMGGGGFDNPGQGGGDFSGGGGDFGGGGDSGGGGDDSGGSYA